MPPRRRQPAKAITYTESSSTSSLSSPSDTDSADDSATSSQPPASNTPRTRARTTRQTRNAANDQPSARLRTRLTRGKRAASKELTPPPGPVKRKRGRRTVESPPPPPPPPPPPVQAPRMRTRNGRRGRQVITDTAEEDSGTESEVESAMDVVDEPEESEAPEESVAAEDEEEEADEEEEDKEEDAKAEEDIVEQPVKEEEDDDDDREEEKMKEESDDEKDVASEQGDKDAEEDEQEDDMPKTAPAKRKRGGRKPRGGGSGSSSAVARKVGRGRPPKKVTTMVLESDSEPANLDDLGDLESDLSSHDGDSTTTSLANMTRRQRARLTHDYDEELMELPTEAKKTKFSAEEMALRKSEQARRRKFQSMQREEQLKNDTINRLLNKQTSKGRNKVDEPETPSGSEEPGMDVHDKVRYRQKCARQSKGKRGEPVHVQRLLLLPRNMAVKDVFPMAAKDVAYPPKPPKCAVDGCNGKKKYSVNSLAVCSLEHWKILKAGQ